MYGKHIAMQMYNYLPAVTSLLNWSILIGEKSSEAGFYRAHLALGKKLVVTLMWVRPELPE